MIDRLTMRVLWVFDVSTMSIIIGIQMQILSTLK